MSLNYHASGEAGLCFPRVSGDEPIQRLARRAMTGFSPRERG
mgnify:CR=1 FL=1